MKHETFEGSDIVDRAGDTADLHRCLWLSTMNPSTRNATVASVAALRSAAGCDGELPVEEFREILEAESSDLKALIGDRWTPVKCDARRALRLWDDLPTRWLALRLRNRVPTMGDAANAAELRLSIDEAARARKALEALAQANNAPLDDLPGAAASVEPLLRASTPETFGVATMKSFNNKKTLVRKAVRLVDPLSSGARETAAGALPVIWRDALSLVGERLKDHETSAGAILRRLAAFSARQDIDPHGLTQTVIDAFVSQELATHNPAYVEKVRAAFRRWNEAVEAGLDAPRLPPPGAPVHRQESVDWESVPESIRGRLDAHLARAVSVRNPGDWGAFVADEDPEYAELGIAFTDVSDQEACASAPILEPGTRRNWRDAVKRVWSAASNDPRVAPKPVLIEELFSRPVVAAVVASVRQSRRGRLEAQGRCFDPQKKGRYEHGLVEALCAIGRALSIDPDRLEAVEELKRQLDPNVVGLKRAADGELKRVYAERRIGERHATMLAAFADMSRLKRWFEAPSVLWRAACISVEAGRDPQATHVALARSALVARIGQYVAPIRRTNYARLRHSGDDRHITLPEGDGEGMLRIPAIEGKTLREIQVRIDSETVRMLKYYIRHFLPVASQNAKASADNPHLFPGAFGSGVEDGGYAPGYGYPLRRGRGAQERG